MLAMTVLAQGRLMAEVAISSEMFNRTSAVPPRFVIDEGAERMVMYFRFEPSRREGEWGLDVVADLMATKGARSFIFSGQFPRDEGVFSVHVGFGGCSSAVRRRRRGGVLQSTEWGGDALVSDEIRALLPFRSRLIPPARRRLFEEICRRHRWCARGRPVLLRVDRRGAVTAEVMAM